MNDVCRCCRRAFEPDYARLFCGTTARCRDDAPCRGECANRAARRRRDCACCREPIEPGARGPVRRYCHRGLVCGTPGCRHLCGKGRRPSGKAKAPGGPEV